MKRSFALVFLLLLFRVSEGQENVLLKDGYTTFKYPNGTISSEGLIKDGKPEGYWKSYYVTGVLKSEGKRSNHMLDSIWIFFDQTGDTTEKISYLYGKKNGWYYKYKRDPSEGLFIWSQELYAGDQKEGIASIFFPDGSVKQTFTYYDGKKEGLSKEFDNTGSIITLLEYHNDFLVSRERINRTDAKKLKQGPWKEFYPDGKIKVEKTYTDDLLHGYYKEYDEKGNLIMTMLYEKGAIVKSKVEDETEIEISNKYNQKGTLIYSGAYRQNVPVGVHRQFGPDGKIINALVYNDNGLLVSQGIVDEAGNFNGRWKDFYADSTVKAEGQYTNNRRTGSWKFYNIQGKLEQTGSYNAGRPDGIWKWFYPGGAVLREEEYFQGEREGAYTEYTENGDIITTGEYLAGEKNGPWKYKSGNLTEEGNYITGLKDGLWKAYYPNGKLRFKGNYIQGNPDGIQTYYFDDGRLKEEQNYDNGIRNKVWKKYDEEGTVILAIAYKNDVEVSINGVRIKLPESDVKLIK
jgi:antitoxin component YwqK of YwqJK toxin-antitoxin module